MWLKAHITWLGKDFFVTDKHASLLRRSMNNKKVLYDWSLVEASPFSAHVGYPPTLVIAEMEDHALELLIHKSFNLKNKFCAIGFFNETDSPESSSILIDYLQEKSIYTQQDGVKPY